MSPKTLIAILLFSYSSFILADSMIQNKDGTITIERIDGSTKTYNNYSDYLKNDPENNRPAKSPNTNNDGNNANWMPN